MKKTNKRQQRVPPSRRRRAKPRQMTIEELDRDIDAVFANANTSGGCNVVDAQGKLRFHIWIPPDVYRDPYADLLG